MTVGEEKTGYCTLCKSRCGAIYSIQDEKLVSVRANPAHPTGAAVCPKGRAAPEIVYNPRRLTMPLRRTAPKTADDPGWEEISWDTALAEIAARLDQIRTESGPEAVAFGVTSPSGTPLSDGIEWVERFIRLFGSPNSCYSTEICNWHKDFAHAFTFGTGLDAPDYRSTDLVLLWGHNPARAWLAQSAAIAEARERGAQVAVVDPRRSGSGLQADHWLRVRPGSDGALALGVADLLISQGAYDEDFIRNWSNGPCLVRSDNGRFLRGSDLDPDLPADCFIAWDGMHPLPYDTRRAAAFPDIFALRGSFRVRTRTGVVDCKPAFQRFLDVSSQWSIERTSAVTWVPEQQIHDFAAAFTAARSVAYYAWSGLAQHTNATQTERAIAVLYALKGCVDAPGGNLVLPKQPSNVPSTPAQLSEGQRGKALGVQERPLGPPSQGWTSARDLYTAILDRKPYPVRALMGFGSNTLISQADPVRGREALRALEFHVHCDLFMNPTAELADIVLPVNSPFEREALKVGFEISHEAQELVQLRQRMVPPVGEARSDTEIVFDLATRLGLGEEFFGGNVEAGWNHVLEPLGLTVAELREQPEGVRLPLPRKFRKYADAKADGVAGFATETRRVEIYSELFARHGYDPVPEFVEPADSPVGEGSDPRFPYVLTCAKSGIFRHSQDRGITSLRTRSAEPSVDLSPELAAAHGISAGDWVVVSTRHASVRLKARLDESLHPRVVVGEYGWWQAAPDLALPGYDPFSDQGSNFNLLIGAEHVDPISGAVPHRSYVCAIALAPADDRQDGWAGERPFAVRALEHEAQDAVSLLLEPLDGRPLPDYRPGQHVTVRLADVPTHAGVSRSYSLSGPATEVARGGYRVTVKRLEVSGLVSEYLTQRLQVGDRVQVSTPTGTFAIPAELDLPVVLIAAGVGITPFMSYLETLATRGSGTDVTLLYSSRDAAHHVFKERIAALAAELPNLRVVNFYTRPGAMDRLGVDHQVAGRMSASDIDQQLIDRRARFYVCATDTMMREVRQGLVSRGVPGFDIFQERFVSPVPTLVIPEDAVHTVRLARSDRELTWRKADGSLLALAEQAGVSMPGGCRVGQCENCTVRVLSGTVQYLQDEVDIGDGDSCLTCQAVPSSDVVLDI